MLTAGRGLWRTFVLLLTIAEAMVRFLGLLLRSRFHPSVRERAAWLHHACGQALRRLDIHWSSQGLQPTNGLIVANHLSYLDILMFSATMPCVFVSKLEVVHWPIFGRMAQMSGTIFINRRRSVETLQAGEAMEAALQQNIPVILFPEGSSSDGTAVLPFYPALFEPAVRLAMNVTPAHIRYAVESGTVENDVCYWGEMTLVPHLFKLLSKRKITGCICFSSHPEIYRDRKKAAMSTREEILRMKGGCESPAEIDCAPLSGEGAGISL